MIESFHPGGLGRRRAALAGLAAAVALSLWGCAQQETPAHAAQSGEPRLVRQIDRPLRPAAADVIETLSCARVMVRCTGACG
jgi:hypothetical protein